jgi:hypothetical protein
MGDWDMFKKYYVDTLKMGQKRDNTDLQLAKVWPFVPLLSCAPEMPFNKTLDVCATHGSLVKYFMDLHLQGQKRQRELEALLKQFMLRRTKDSTIKDQLPKKTDNIVFCQLAPLQMRAYR